MPKGTSPILARIAQRYEFVKKQGLQTAQSPEVSNFIIQLTQVCLDFLSSKCIQVPLVSKVPGKQYFSFKLGGNAAKISRPVNRQLFNLDLRSNLKKFQKAELVQMSFADRASFLYTVAIAYCCATDLLKTGDQKTPATFFECLIRHLLARTFGVNPRTQVEVLRLEEEGTTLPTDLIFDLGGTKPKFHVPVKISTRERVIQVFAHQRVLDGVHGFNRFKGILVCLTETKLDHRTREVVEICLPKQWDLYQRFIAPMHRFYYFDVPKKYADLSQVNSSICVAPFAQFFDEASDLALGR
jgi:hypothetical protein